MQRLNRIKTIATSEVHHFPGGWSAKQIFYSIVYTKHNKQDKRHMHSRTQNCQLLSVCTSLNTSYNVFAQHCTLRPPQPSLHLQSFVSTFVASQPALRCFKLRVRDIFPFVQADHGAFLSYLHTVFGFLALALHFLLTVLVASHVVGWSAFRVSVRVIWLFVHTDQSPLV